MERQKLRAQALADELGSLIEYAARKVLGETALTKLKLQTPFRCQHTAIDLRRQTIAKS